MFCPKCGTQNQDNNYQCTKCGEILRPRTPAPAVVVSYGWLGKLVSYQNGPAVAAFCCGACSAVDCFFVGLGTLSVLFSHQDPKTWFELSTFIGIGLGIAAFFLGLKGLRNAREHPEVNGKSYARAGIIVGGFFALSYLILLAWLASF
jgi:zinc ribbon protein